MSVVTTRTGDPVYDTFIKRSLGTLLPDCIKQLTECRPADPIEFISNSLYKAVDSQLYKKEKEKYLNDCLKESTLLQKERSERNARLDMLLEAHRENKEKLKQARQDEINALSHLAKNAEKYGIKLSPRSLRRLNNLKRENLEEMAAERPLQITMPHLKKGAKAESPKEKSGKKPRGKWVEVEEEIITDSGTVITVKRRKWLKAPRSRGAASPHAEDEDELMADVQRRRKDDKRMEGEYSSIFDDDVRLSDVSQGIIAITDRGFFTYQGGTMGTVQPPDPLDRQLAPADNPDIWWKERFDCHTLYDHELYIRCDADADFDINQHASPPRRNMREYLESMTKDSKEDSHGVKVQNENQQRLQQEEAARLRAKQALLASAVDDTP